MKYAEISALTNEEIVARIQEGKATLTKLKFAHAVSSIENPARINKARKEVARLSTELSKRQAKAASESNS
ncbi:50S ribosomal protein L29 [Pseudoxanthomonas sp. SGD-10]|nr:50S ribosomal protein L29 [Pseudoxanthomonas sp. SGD-10]